MKLRVALVGLGDQWEYRHRPALNALADRYEVRAVYSEIAVRAEQVALRFGVKPATGFRELAQRPDIDAALILSRGWHGALPVLAFCEAGKSIYSAAELELDPLHATELKRRVDQSGVAFMAELHRRQAPATLRLKELIATRLGPPSLIFCHTRFEGDTQRNISPRRNVPTRTSTREMIELVDWCRFVVGNEPASVVGVKHMQNEHAAANDYRMLSLDFSTAAATGIGPLAHVSFGTYLPQCWPEAATFRRPPQMQICCQRGVAFVDLPNTLVWFDEGGQHTESLDSERPIGERLLMQFYRAVTSLVRRSSDLDDAYRSLKIVLAGDQSIRERRTILLKDD